MEEFFRPKVADRWNGKIDGASAVSAYAGNSKKEFVAEIFLGILIGRNYSQELKDAYKALDGPECPGFL